MHSYTAFLFGRFAIFSIPITRKKYLAENYAIPFVGLPIFAAVTDLTDCILGLFSFVLVGLFLTFLLLFFL